MKRTSWRRSVRFALTVAALTIPIGSVFDTSTIFLNDAAWYIGVVIVLVIVTIGVVFDMVGLAAAAARETPFHAMASKRIFGAKRAIQIVRNAEKVSSICSDVVGDIAGVLSGAGALAVATQLVAAVRAEGWQRELIVILLTALITAVTVGMKAIGKTIAIQSPTPIILIAAKAAESVFFVWRKPRASRSRKSTP